MPPRGEVGPWSWAVRYYSAIRRCLRCGMNSGFTGGHSRQQGASSNGCPFVEGWSGTGMRWPHLVKLPGWHCRAATAPNCDSHWVQASTRSTAANL